VGYKDPEAQKQYHAEWHQANKERRMPLIQARKKKHKEAMRAWIQEMKSSTPCTDCGKLFPHYVMDFDHVTDDKDKALSVGVQQGWSQARLQKEIDKCELVCSNCHRERTHKRSTRHIWDAARL
jgi:hypothetical protein